MKNKVLVIAALALAACKKDVPNAPTATTNYQMLQVGALDFTIIENPHNVYDYILNPEDLDDQKIQTNLHNIGLMARDLFKSNFYNQLIIEEALNHDNLSIKLSKFLEDVQAQNENHQSILSAMQTEIANMDFTRTYTSSGTGQVLERYIPAIFVVNAETADPNLPPIVSSGVYVNSELPETANFDDYIVAWIFDDHLGIWKEILVNEEMAMSTNYPIFIMDNAEESISNRPRTVFANSGSGKTTTTKKLFAMNDYQINYRYESSGKSELAVACLLIDENGNIHRTLFKNNGNNLDQEEKASIVKSSIGKMHWNQWESITEIEFQVIDLEPFNQNALVWNTFERDWAKGSKPLGHYTKNGVTAYISGNRTFSSEWYTHNGVNDQTQASLLIQPLDFDYIWAAWSKKYDNARSDIRIWRYGGI